MTAALRLTATARADLAGIRDYTVREWGRPQWLRYYRALAQCLDRIATRPGIGRSRDGLLPGLRSLKCQSHQIFWRLSAAGFPVVTRILHQRQTAAGLDFAEDLA